MMVSEVIRMQDEVFMDAALELAKQAAAEGEVPVGCVIVRNGQIVGRGRNRRETEKTALGHGEIEAIADACRNLGGWRLWDCTLYVTLEPCPMCTGAIINSRLAKVTFGAYDLKSGSMGSVINLCDLPYNSKPEIVGGFMQEECASPLSEFFGALRVRKSEEKKRRKEEQEECICISDRTQ